jgi:3-hydroxyacyl-[acyl-carrier-protein] dehydratase
VLTYEIEVLNLRPEGALVAGRVQVEGVVTVEAEIFFAYLDQNRSQQLFGSQNFVFTGELQYLLGRFTGKAPGAKEVSPPPNGSR